MLTDFYIAFSTICFTLLGLWLVVVQTRHAEWRDSEWHRRRAFAVMWHFALPGMMTLLALVDPASRTLWRTTFAIAALGGVAALVLLLRRSPTGIALLGYVAVVLLYAAVCLIAVAPGVVSYSGGPAAVRVESVLLALIVFVGVNVAWLLLFEPAPDQRVGARVETGVRAE